GVRELVPRAVRLRAPRSARLSQRDAIRLTDRRAARADRSRLRMEGRRPSLPLDRQLVSRVRSLFAWRTHPAVLRPPSKDLRDGTLMALIELDGVEKHFTVRKRARADTGVTAPPTGRAGYRRPRTVVPALAAAPSGLEA